MDCSERVLMDCSERSSPMVIIGNDFTEREVMNKFAGHSLDDPDQVEVSITMPLVMSDLNDNLLLHERFSVGE